MDRKAEIQALLDKYRQNRCTQEELLLLADLLQTSAVRDDMAKLLGESLLDGIPSSFLEQPEVQESLHSVFNRIMPDETKPIVLPKPGRRWKHSVITAAAIIVSFGAFWYFFVHIQPDSGQQDAVSWGDARAGGNRAILTLADGRTIDLRADQNGIAVGKELSYLDGSEILADSGENPGNGVRSASSALMTLRTPKGGTYRIVLSDGTEVWLNAGSTLTYPAQFSPEERRVTLEGEAFFSVSRQVRVPFRVVAGKQEINVLGTEFNISAYEDNIYSSTTLLTGSVTVRNKTSGEVVRLVPGTQSIVNDDQITVAKADVDAVTGWKNGVFLFNDTELRDAMKQIMRWYDIEVEYEGYVPTTHFFGEIGRDKTLAQVLKIFKRGKVEFRFDKEKNKLIVYHRKGSEDK